MPITSYLQRDYWDEPRADRVLVGVEGGTIIGYGAWTLADPLPTWKKGAPPEGWQSHKWIRIPRFGVDAQFQGLPVDEAVKYADHIYAALEADIKESWRTDPPMFIELFTHRDNERAMRFWQRQGFRDIGTSEGDPRYRRFIRWPWP